MLLCSEPIVTATLERDLLRDRVELEGEQPGPCGLVGRLCDLLVCLRLRDGKLFVNEARRDAEPNLPDEDVQDVRRLGEVFGLLAVEAYLRDALVLAEVKENQRADEIAPECGRQSLTVCDGQVMPDIVVGLALGVAAAARV